MICDYRGHDAVSLRFLWNEDLTMSDNSATNRAESRMPSDDQTDVLLRDFFRLEVPTELNQPLRRNQLAAVTTPDSGISDLSYRTSN